MSGLKPGAARKPGPTQHRSFPYRLSLVWGVLFPKLSKLLNQGDALSAPCFFAGSLGGCSTASPDNAAERFDPPLLISRYCLLHLTHHAGQR